MRMVGVSIRVAHPCLAGQIAGGGIVGVAHRSVVVICPPAALSRGGVVGEIYPYDLRLSKYTNEVSFYFQRCLIGNF